MTRANSTAILPSLILLLTLSWFAATAAEPAAYPAVQFPDSVSDPAIETTVTFAQGLPSGKHTLEISGSETTPIAALRVYRPPLQPEAKR